MPEQTRWPARSTTSRTASASTAFVGRSSRLAFLNHDLGGLDYRGHLVALLEAHFFGATFGYYGLDDIVADLHRDQRGNGPENYFGDFTFQMIASTESHRRILLKPILNLTAFQPVTLPQQGTRRHGR